MHLSLTDVPVYSLVTTKNGYERKVCTCPKAAGLKQMQSQLLLID